MNAYKENRFGLMFLSVPLIEEAGSDLRVLFSHFVPVYAVYNGSRECYEYVGYSDKFEALPTDRAVEIPIYKPIFQSEQDVLSSERIVSLLEFRRC